MSAVSVELWRPIGDWPGYEVSSLGRVRSWRAPGLVFSAKCAFTYFRRERADNPLKKGKRLEREHEVDFERRVQRARKRIDVFERPGPRRKERADAEEKSLRQDRLAMARVACPYSDYGHDNSEEFELPYTPEAWAGIQRIAATLREMKAKLDEFARGATPAVLAQLAKGDVFKMLPAPKAP